MGFVGVKIADRSRIFTTMTNVEIAIIGAGFAGLGAAIRLKQSGRNSFVIFERAAEVGGTWRDNVYPGCACDVPSHLYSFSFAPNPNWSRKFSPQPEILDYLKNVVQQFDLGAKIQYNTEIIRTEFSEETGRWTLTDRAGNVTTARVVIGAIGPLNRPSVPKLPGIESFAGQVFHSSEWDTSAALAGKRVVVLGTGASAIQIIPAITPVVEHLTVFQRTAPYVMPRRDAALSAGVRGLFSKIPALRQTYRTGIYWTKELGGLSFIGNKTMRRIATFIARKHREDAIKDPALRQKATPAYELGCKRVLISDDYFPALTRPNVSLVTDAIDRVTPTSILDKAGQEHPADAIILSTGFVAADIICDLHITGRSGRVLLNEWAKNGPEAHYGITVSGYPNMLFLVGPNTGLGHTSIVHMIESQMNYVLSYLDLLDKVGPIQSRPDAFLDVKHEAQTAYNLDIQERMKTTVWASGCQSWYMNEQGKNTTLWPDLTVTYRKATRQVNPEEYEVG